MIAINDEMIDEDTTHLYLASNNLNYLSIEIGQLTKLSSLVLSYNKLTHLPVEIGKLSQLYELVLSYNKLNNLPVEMGYLTQLTTLDLYSNQFTILPVVIGQLVNLTTLKLCFNQLTYLPVEIGQLTNLITLDLYGNQLTQLPVVIGQLASLTNLDLSYNNLSSLPVEIVHLEQLTKLAFYNNPIENILNPIIQRFLNRIQNRILQDDTIYSDGQNIHSSSIQQSIQKSIYNLMNNYDPDYEINYLDWNDVSTYTKQIITEYIDMPDIHSMLNITFKELFTSVCIEIDNLELLDNKNIITEIHHRLNEEMQESECKCFTGRMSRLVNCLSGYSPKVNISISDNEEIGNIISIMKTKHFMEPINVLKELIHFALLERGYKEEQISLWLEHVE